MKNNSFNFLLKTKLIVLNVSLYLFTINGCNTTSKYFGTSFIKKDTDSINIKNTFSKISIISNNLFDSGIFVNTKNDSLRYRLLKPSVINSNKKTALVIIFHGSGEIGRDNNKQLGLISNFWALENLQSKYPAFILAPQFSKRSSNYKMDSTLGVLSSKPSSELDVALTLIDSIVANFNVDKDRIYLIGFSMGASTTINAILKRPTFFAGAVSIAGIPQFENIASIKSTPLWLMHGNMDDDNPILSDNLFYSKIKEHKNVRYWIFEKTKHVDIISPIILGENIPKWLFGFIRR